MNTSTQRKNPTINQNNIKGPEKAWTDTGQIINNINYLLEKIIDISSNVFDHFCIPSKKTVKKIFGAGVGTFALYGVYHLVSKRKLNSLISNLIDLIWKNSKEYIQKQAIKNCEKEFVWNSKSKDHPVVLTDRCGYEDKINEIIKKIGLLKFYYVMVGIRGAGKSTLLRKVLNGKKGVIIVEIDSELSKYKKLSVNQISSLVLHEMGIDMNVKSSKKYLAEILGKSSIKPLVVFEVASKTDKESFIGVTKWCKQFVSDKFICSSIINVSSALPTYTMSYQDKRRKFIHIGLFTDDEAKEYLKRSNPKITDEIKKIIEKIGTSPQDLYNVINDPKYIETQEKESYDAIDKSILENKNIAMVYKKILQNKKEKSEGVLRNVFNASLSDKELGRIIMEYKTLEYNPNSRKLIFYSKSMENATKKYFNEKK